MKKITVLAVLGTTILVAGMLLLNAQDARAPPPPPPIIRQDIAGGFLTVGNNNVYGPTLTVNPSTGFNHFILEAFQITEGGPFQQGEAVRITITAFYADGDHLELNIDRTDAGTSIHDMVAWCFASTSTCSDGDGQLWPQGTMDHVNQIQVQAFTNSATSQHTNTQIHLYVVEYI